MGRSVKLWGWIVLLGAGCDVVLARGLADDRARELVAELDQHGIPVRAIRESATHSMRLETGRDSVAEAVTLLGRAQHERAAARGAEAASEQPTRWVETRSEQRQREATGLARALESSLQRLPEVVEARVHISLPSGLGMLPETETQPAASVLLLLASDNGSQRAAAQELVAGAVGALAPEAVRVVEALRPRAVGRPAQLAHVGPIAVARASASALRLLLAASLVLHIVLASALLWPLARRLWPSRSTARVD
jgi:type III secretory pathway lipoprotein EscJ